MTWLDGIRLPPQELEAERGLLGSLLLSPHLFEELPVSADDFYAIQHGVIYKVVQSMWSKGWQAIDIITICTELSRTGQLESIGGAAYLAEIIECVPHSSHGNYYANIVLEASRKRRVIYECTDILKRIYEGPGGSDDAVDSMDRFVTRMQDTLKIDAVSTTRIAIQELIAERDNPAAVSPIGLESVDRKLTGGGITGGQLIVAAGRPSSGKSVLVCQIAKCFAQRSQPSLIVSLEMRNREIMDRLSKSAQLSDLESIPMFMCESMFSAERIGQLIKVQKRKNGIKLAVIDYLQLMESVENDRRSREQQIAGFTRQMKKLAKNLDIPIVVACQLNRASDKEVRRPRLSDLRESGAIEQDADTVLLVHHQDVDSEIVIAKQRGGATTVVPIVFDRVRTLFRDLDVMSGFTFSQ